MKSLESKIIALVVLMGLLSGSFFAQPKDVVLTSKIKGLYTTVLSLPVGDDLRYEYDELDEIEKVGPSSFAITPNGEFVIADTPTNRILWFSPNGDKTKEIAVEGAVGITDLEVSNGEIYALDAGAEYPIVFRLNEAGALLDKIFVSPAIRDEGLTGVKIGDGGELFYEIKNGAEFVGGDGNRISEQDSALALVEAPFSDDKISGLINRIGRVTVGDKKFPEVRVQNYLGGLQPLAVADNGDIFIGVTEVASVPTIYVDQTIRRYDKSGDLLGIARVPINESYVYVQNNVVVTSQGEAFALIARQKSLDIVKLRFKNELNPILPVETKVKETLQIEAQNAASCSISRDQIMANAEAYLNNRVYLNNSNINGACFGRRKPSYLGNAGTYSSVPYKWGGGDSVSQFNIFMSSTNPYYQAGDIPLNADDNTLSCAKGVDCSGFITRVWGIPLPAKESTTTLPNSNISSSLVSRENLQPGDILNLSGSHVVLFNTFEPNGITAYESTVTNNVDRVVKVFSNWSRLIGYTPYRYKNVCTGSFSISASPATVTVARGSTATFGIYTSTSDGFRGAVNFYALNLPGQVISGTGFTPASVDIRNNNSWYITNLKIATNSSTPRGNFTITVEGRSGSGTARSYVYLKVL